MGGNFSRLYTRSTGGTISGPNDDAEFDNVITNFTPTGLDDYSANIAQMQSTADPYPGSVESPATSGAGELERLRYLIKQITGEAQWYIDPDVNLASILSTYTTLANIQANAMNYAVDSGSADALAVAFTPTITALTPGMILVVKTAAANATSTPTLAVDGTGAIGITRNSGVLNAGDIKADGYSVFQYYSTGWNLLNPILTGTADIVDGAVTAAKATALLGTRTVRAVATVYGPVTADTIVHALDTAGAAAPVLAGYADAFTPPTTIRVRYSGNDGAELAGITMVVKKGEYWKVTSTKTTAVESMTLGS